MSETNNNKYTLFNTVKSTNQLVVRDSNTWNTVWGLVTAYYWASYPIKGSALFKAVEDYVNKKTLRGLLEELESYEKRNNIEELLNNIKNNVETEAEENLKSLLEKLEGYLSEDDKKIPNYSIEDGNKTPNKLKAKFKNETG